MKKSVFAKWVGFIGMGVILAVVLALPQTTQAAVQRVKFQSGSNYLIVEFLNDDLMHFEVSGAGPGPDASSPIFTTPQVFKTDYAGPDSFVRSGTGGNTLDTTDMKVVVNTGSLCVTVTDKTKSLELTTICPVNLSQTSKGLTITPGGMQHVYGLGEQFIEPAGNPDGDWTGRLRTSPDPFGNQMIGFNGGANGNAQFPVMYAVGAGNANYALFLDHIYKQTWDFTGSPWKVTTLGDQIRGYLMTGPNVPSLRQAYMDLTGHSPVPPKKMFGLWVSEFGFDKWQEIDGKLSRMRADKFPIDGFVLDLEWFGGVPATGNTPSHMGSLTFDEKNFPDPAGKLKTYKDQEGIGIMTIEESFIDKGLPEHADLQNREFLAKQCKNGPNGSCNPALTCPAATCPPVFLTQNPWWGRGGMIDWTQDAAGDYWHDLKRQPLIDKGVIGHWIDLGEPETYGDQQGQPDWTGGILPGKHAHADYHNLYNFKWAQSIARGYTRNNVMRRPFMMARSGAAGIQRFGATMWSGDIGSDLANLRTHFNAQMHMSMSGMDYFGADIGGFHRQGGDPNNMYTVWFANGMMFDVPGRPHTDNHDCPFPPPTPPSGNCHETAPDLIGDKASNLMNVRQRYELSPYLYSLAHRAYLAAEPVAPPLVYYYQNDMNVREMGNEKLLGRDLLVVTDADQDLTAPLDVYLPAGDWVNYHTNEWFHSTGQTFTGQTVLQDGLFRLLTYARAGAILPKMFVDDKTMNVVGKRADGSTRNELIVRVYAAKAPSGFTLYEDDGETIAYQSGAVRTTPLSQQLAGNGLSGTVTIAAAQGTYDGASASRNNIVELVTDGMQEAVKKPVTLNGNELPQQTSRAAFDAADSGWLNAGNGLILAKSGNMQVADSKTFAFNLEPGLSTEVFATFVCMNGDTVLGQLVYVVGSIDRLGNWNPAKAVKLDPNGPYPTWTGVISKLPPSTTIEWKCIKRPETGDISRIDMWQPDPNNVLKTPEQGDAGKTTGDFKPGPGPGPGPGPVVSFVCDNGTTVPGQSVYVVGSIPALGNWTPAKAVKLDPTNYPRWTGTVSNLSANTKVEWKCIKRPETADSPVVWEPDPNNVVTTPASGTVTTNGSF